MSDECIEAVGGEVRRVFLARNRGITDPGLTVERAGARWDEMMDDRVDAILQAGAFDPTQWDIRPYEGNS